MNWLFKIAFRCWYVCLSVCASYVDYQHLFRIHIWLYATCRIGTWILCGRLTLLLFFWKIKRCWLSGRGSSINSDTQVYLVIMRSSVVKLPSGFWTERQTAHTCLTTCLFAENCWGEYLQICLLVGPAKRQLNWKQGCLWWIPFRLAARGACRALAADANSIGVSPTASQQSFFSFLYLLLFLFTDMHTLFHACRKCVIKSFRPTHLSFSYAMSTLCK